MVEGLLNFIITILALRLIFTILIRIKSRRDMRKKVKAYTNTVDPRKNDFSEAIQPKEVAETIKGEYCGAIVPKKDSYIAVIDDEKHYFCSWECRQKYIAEKKERENNLENTPKIIINSKE